MSKHDPRPIPGVCPAGCGTSVANSRYRCDPCSKKWCAEIAARKAALLADRKRWSTMRRIPSRTDSENKWREHVSRSTKTAVRLGLLPDPVNCTCVDCGRGAECYDHRDYSRPLDVEPVCLMCNSVRGRGEMPAPRSVVQVEMIAVKKAA